MRLHLGLVGFGNVAQRFVRLIHEQRDALAALGVEPVIVGIATRRHGCAWHDAGMDAATLDALATRAAAGDAVGPALNSPAAEVIERLSAVRSDARVLVETTVLNVQSGEPAAAHVRAALSAGVHVISANKGPVACAYRELADLAAATKRSFLFEGAVMDGVPIFNLVRETMPAAEIHGFRGVINSTTNHLLSALERGDDFDAALARMQAEGVAEADPSLDVDGWDAAAKVAALANVWLDARITPAEVGREGVSAACGDRARALRAAGRRLKLVGSASRESGRVRARVALEDLPGDDPLAILDGQANALEIDSWPLGRVVITQRDGGMEKTAYALVSDLVTVARRLQ